MIRAKKTDRKKSAGRATVVAAVGLAFLGALSFSADADEISGRTEKTITELPMTLQATARRWKVDPSQVTAVVIPLDRVNMKIDETAGDPMPILAVNADKRISPASTAKLVTTLVALDRLGINFRWKTDFYADRLPDNQGKIQTLWIRGGGDPTLVVEDFALEIHRLMGHGVRHIEGNIVVDRSHFSLPKGDPAAFDGRASRPYNLLPDPAIINYRNLSFEMTPVPGKDYARIVTLPVMAGVTVPQTIALKKKGGCGNWKEAIGYRMETLKNGEKRVRFNGALPRACGPRNFNVIAFDENEYIERLFRTLWEKEGGTWNGKVISGTVPQTGVTLSQQRLSPSLADTVRLVNKWSNNLIARHIFLSLGNVVIAEEERQERDKQSTSDSKKENSDNGVLSGSLPYRRSLMLEDARQVITEWMQDNGIDPTVTYIDNGSGLSRETKTTAKAMAQLLAAGWKSPAMSDFMASLPVSGVDGTMARRKVAVRYGHFKTGFLSDVRSVGGYVLARNGRRYAVFASVHGTKNMPGGTVFLDNVIQWVFNLEDEPVKNTLSPVEKRGKNE